MTREEALEYFKNKTVVLTEEEALANTMAIKALEQEHCEGDCISREAVLNIAKSSKSNWIDNSVLFKRVNALPSVQPKAVVAENTTSEKTEWIPVSERLPDHTDYYLIQYSRKICADEMAVAFYSAEEAELDSNYTWEFKPQCGEYKEVLAWQPLPKPYSEVKQ